MALFNRRKRDVEPILAISIVIFLVASGAVVSMSIFGSYVNEEDLPVAPGRDVKVYYTGSLYDYYDGEGALIFDSNIRDHIEKRDELYSFVGGFSKTGSDNLDALGFTHGKGELLAMFEDALTGHKAGETVRVEIPFGDGYESKNMERSKTFTVPKEERMDQKKFESIYDVYVPSGGFPVEFETIYGWDAYAVYDSKEKEVIITHNPDDGEAYELKSNELNVHGSVKVTPTLHGDEIECAIEYELNDGVEDEYMLWVKTHSMKFYIYGETEGGLLKITENPAAEGTVYFVITIESVSERD